MGWVKLDDGFYDHPKARVVGKDGRELYGVSLCHAARYDTNGEVFAADLPLLAAKAEVDVDAVAPLLVAVGLWHDGTHECAKCPQPTREGSYIIHKYLERNPSAEEAEARREHLARIRAAAGRKGGEAKAASKAGKRGSKPLANGVAKPLAQQGKPRPPYVVGDGEASPASQGGDALTELIDLTDELVMTPAERARRIRSVRLSVLHGEAEEAS